MSLRPAEHKLTGMTWEHVRGHGCLVASDPFLQSNLGINVDWTARSLLAFGDQKIEEFYQDFDLMVIDYPHIPDAVAAGTVLPFEDFVSAADLDQLAQESVGGSHHSYLFRNKHWALALDAASQVSAYRPDRADCAPLTWNDAKEIGKAGKLLWPYKPVDAFSTFATLCAQLGAPLAGGIASGKGFIDNQIAAEALELMIEFTHLVPDFCATFNPIDTAEALADDGPYSHALALYGYTNYGRVGFRKNLLSYDDIPSFDGQASGACLGGTGIAVSSATKNPEAAFKAALTLAKGDVQSTVYTKAGGQPGNLRAWKSRECNEITNYFFRNTLRTLERAWIRPPVIGWPDIQMEISKIVHPSLVAKKLTGKEVGLIAQLYDRHAVIE